MKLLTETEMKEAQKRLDEINNSGRYSFKQTIDERGCIIVDCDLDTLVREMNLISADDAIKKLNSKAVEYISKYSK